MVSKLYYKITVTLKLEKLGNIRKVSHLSRDIAYCQVSLLEIKLWQEQSKRTH